MNKRKPSKLISRIGKNVASKRKALGLTQEQLSAQVQVEVETISRMERGLHSPSLAMLELVSDVLHISISDLLDEQAPAKLTETEVVATYLSQMKPRDRLFITDFVKLYFQRTH
ncbi:helix-turn-helix domain-containing protein [Undibacterium sp. Rencai35W]|uniref:helix-turn-helix domain-containing protein n=1 Tax=Undibacterium sp. Rencai35W TaxID=3413046 RepID=UPI003BF3EB02